MWTAHLVEPGASHQAEWFSPRPGRDELEAACQLCLRRSSCVSIKQFTGSQHGVHDDGKLAGDRDRRTFEADPLAKL